MTPDANPTGTPPGRAYDPLPLLGASRGPRGSNTASTSADPVVIDCERCSMRGVGCGDCMVTVLLGGPPYGVALDDQERRAIEVLAEAGLIPPLRMVSPVDSIHIVPDG
jgi:N-methylhydantoinase B/oxoprolinase/acetone carboxylase alpha subunit